MKSIKRTIRLERAQHKLNKKVYPANLTERKIIKLSEAYDQLSKDIERTWRMMYANGFKPGKDNNNPVYFNDFDFINGALKEQEKISRQIDRLLKAVNKSMEDVLANHYRINAGRGSVSYG